VREGEPDFILLLILDENRGRRRREVAERGCRRKAPGGAEVDQVLIFVAHGWMGAGPRPNEWRAAATVDVVQAG